MRRHNHRRTGARPREGDRILGSTACLGYVAVRVTPTRRTRRPVPTSLTPPTGTPGAGNQPT